MSNISYNISNKKILVIGAGLVARTFLGNAAKYERLNITLISRTISSEFQEFTDKLVKKYGSDIKLVQLDLFSDEFNANIATEHYDIMVNLASPYENIILKLMNDCLKNNIDYIDTAAPEDESGHISYDKQWNLASQFKEKGLKAILGMGSSPGTLSVLVKDIELTELNSDSIEDIRLLDINNGNNTNPKMQFHTNFDTSTNLTEFQGNATYFDKGEEISIPAWSDKFSDCGISVLPTLNNKISDNCYTIEHEEQLSLSKSYPNALIKNYMSFGPKYIELVEFMKRNGLMTTDDSITLNGVKYTPLDFVANALPTPEESAPTLQGNILMATVVNGKYWRYVELNHEASYKLGGSSVSSSTSIPALASVFLIDLVPQGMVNAEHLCQESISLFKEKLSKYGFTVKQGLVQ